jgi:8-amino-7-oxononanoate synthase
MRNDPLSAALTDFDADDLSSLLLLKARRQDAAAIGFYDRKSRTWSESTHGEFLGRAASVGAELRNGGVHAGDYVIVACATPESVLLAFAGSVLIGAVPTILPIRTAFDDQAAIARRLEDTFELLGPSTSAVVEVAAGKPIVSAPQELRSFPLDLSTVSPSVDISSFVAGHSGLLSHVQLTSGSTGAGKGVAVSHANVFANVATLQDAVSINEHDVCLSWLPLYHDMGLVSQALTALVLGLDLYLMSPFDFLADPMLWLRAISEKRGSLSASPTFGYDLVVKRSLDQDLSSLDLSSWKFACCGGEPVRADVLRRFEERFLPSGLRPTTFSPGYGLAEATLAVSGVGDRGVWESMHVSRASLGQMSNIEIVDASTPDASEVVSLGPALLNMSISLINAEGSPVMDELVCGEIVVNGDSVTPGWIEKGGEIRPFPKDGLHTGDIGFIYKGELFVAERIKNIVIRNGHNYSSQVIEQTLAEVVDISVADVVVVDRDIALGAGLTGVVELPKGSEPLAYLRTVQASVDQFEPPLESLVFVKRGSLPRTTSGKKQHMAVREGLNASTLKVVAEYDLADTANPDTVDVAIDLAKLEAQGDVRYEHDELESRVLEIVSGHARKNGVDVPVVVASRLQYDLDFDSLGLLELAMAVETAFGVQLTREAVAEAKTVRDLVSIVEAAAIERSESADGLSKIFKKLRSQIPQTYATVDDVQTNRRALIDGRWKADFASSNYLGLDENPAAYKKIDEYHEHWGMQRCWTRAVATPKPVIELERRLSDLIGVEDVMIFPTVTLLHFGVLPLLAGVDGAIIIDTAAHKSMHEASALARAKGATVTSFKHRDAADLEAKLARSMHKARRIIVVDGVYSMTGQTVDLARYQELAETYDALLYVDDAHGFGVLGENPTAEMPYGFRGNGVVRHLGRSYDRILYIGGLSKAFSTMAAFVSCPNAEYRQLFQAASTMIFVHSVPIATVAQAHSALDINETDGDEIRGKLLATTNRLREGAERLGYEVSSTVFPIVNVINGDLGRSLLAINTLWDDDVMLTPAIFPAAPLDRGGLRLSVTGANTIEQVDQVIDSLARLKALNEEDAQLSNDLSSAFTSR